MHPSLRPICNVFEFDGARATRQVGEMIRAIVHSMDEFNLARGPNQRESAGTDSLNFDRF